METKTRLDKAINGLHEIVRRNKKQNQFIFTKDTIIIDNSSSELGAIILLSIILLIPIGLILYYFAVDKTNLIVLLLLVSELLLVHDFYKLLRGNTTLTINFKEKYIGADNTFTSLKQIFPSNKIPFSEINKIDLKETSISWQQQWLQLLAFDKHNKKIVLTDFSKVYPESFIATKVKFLIDVIIWTEKQN